MRLPGEAPISGRTEIPVYVFDRVREERARGSTAGSASPWAKDAGRGSSVSRIVLCFGDTLRCEAIGVNGLPDKDILRRATRGAGARR